MADGDNRLSQGIDKLQVGEAVRTALGSLWLQRRQIAGWTVAPLLLVAVIELLAHPYVAGLDRLLLAEPGATWQTGLVVAGQLRDVMQMAVWTVLELACYRLFLLGSVAGPAGSPMRTIYLSLLTFNIVLMGVANAPSLAVAYARIADAQPTWEALSLLAFLFYMFIGIRLAFVFPAISLGWPWDLPRRWSETAGNFWRLLGAMLLGFVPMYLLSVLFSAMGFNTSGYALSPGLLSVAEAAARSVLSLVLVLCATAVTAAAVCQLTGFRAAGMTGQPPGPTDIAKRFD